MTVKQAISKFLGGTGNTRDSCSTDPETKKMFCKRTRVNSDGTEVELAQFDVEIDSDCKPVISNFEENEEGAFESLSQKVIPKVVGKCRRRSTERPGDY